jgi:hypothetical protein
MPKTNAGFLKTGLYSMGIIYEPPILPSPTISKLYYAMNQNHMPEMSAWLPLKPGSPR